MVCMSSQLAAAIPAAVVLHRPTRGASSPAPFRRSRPTRGDATASRQRSGEGCSCSTSSSSSGPHASRARRSDAFQCRSSADQSGDMQVPEAPPSSEVRTYPAQAQAADWQRCTSVLSRWCIVCSVWRRRAMSYTSTSTAKMRRATCVPTLMPACCLTINSKACMHVSKRPWIGVWQVMETTRGEGDVPISFEVGAGDLFANEMIKVTPRG